MASQSDVREIDGEGKTTSKRRFDVRDFDYIAETVIQEYEDRKSRRKDRERCWKEIDRQIAMEPEIGFKKLPNGRIDPKKHWMAEIEMPLQAQALEVLTADARRMLFPDSGAWFRAHAEMTDDYLREADFSSLVLGDENDVPSQINQDNADKLIEGFLLHLFDQPFNGEDFFTRYDRINAEAFKYGVGVGRARMMTHNLYATTKLGVAKSARRVPVLAPASIWNVYLDDAKPTTHSLQLLEPAHISVDYIRLENLHMAASRGSSDPDDEDGGWMPKALKNLAADDRGYVTLLEMEGDVIVPRKTTRSMVIPGAVVTVALGGKDTGGNATRGVVRFRFRKWPFMSYLLHPYHFEGASDPYPTSPLMKGRPVQGMATDAANRLLDCSMLKIAPPVSWDRTDQFFAQTGGPEIYPYAAWGTTDPSAIKAHNDIGGDPSALVGMFTQALSLYAELTGVLPARLGAQTNSHTTAFAKDAELQRGAVRTVDYVRQIGNGPMNRWLGMAYQMGRSAIRANETARFYIDAYGGFVEVTREQLPETASFEWFGSGGPAEEQQKRQSRLQSLSVALQMDQVSVALGNPPTIDVPAAIREVLREGKWTDVDAIVKIASAMHQQRMLPGPNDEQMMQGPGPGAVVAALQNLTGAV